MDQADAEEPEEKKLTAEELLEKIEEMKRRRAKAEKMKKQMNESGETQISHTDPDGRMTHAPALQAQVCPSVGDAERTWARTSR
jgi:hypothetical protein